MSKTIRVSLVVGAILGIAVLALLNALLTRAWPALGQAVGVTAIALCIIYLWRLRLQGQFYEERPLLTRPRRLSPWLIILGLFLLVDAICLLFGRWDEVLI